MYKLRDLVSVRVIPSAARNLALPVQGKLREESRSDRAFGAPPARVIRPGPERDSSPATAGSE